MLEIGGALALAASQNPGSSEAELVRAAARLLGFRRLGSELNDRISLGLAAMGTDGRISSDSPGCN